MLHWINIREENNFKIDFLSNIVNMLMKHYTNHLNYKIVAYCSKICALDCLILKDMQATMYCFNKAEILILWYRKMYNNWNDILSLSLIFFIYTSDMTGTLVPVRPLFL
jgi:hypothetical protein